MTPGTVLLGLRHIRGLRLLRQQARDSVGAVREELRRLGAHGLANELTTAMQFLGQQGDVLHAVERAAERGGTVDGELRARAVSRRPREVA